MKRAIYPLFVFLWVTLACSLPTPPMPPTPPTQAAITQAPGPPPSTELQAHCPPGDAPVVLHGFSRGSALTYHLALLDRAPEGRKLFAAFIADSSGTGPAGTGDTPPGYLKDAPEDAYAGARFWLYCGLKDYDGVRCDDMEKAQQHILAHGGTVDELYVNPDGGHSIFIGRDTEQQRRVLADLFAYVDSVGDMR